VPVADVDDLLADDDAKVIATGLGLDPTVVAQTLGEGLVTAAIDPSVNRTAVPTDLAGVMADGPALSNLARRVHDVARDIVEQEQR
jgi:hypothetical protein